MQRVCRRQIGAALTRLRQSMPPASIHGARKEIKKLRALLQLVQGVISRRDHRQARKSLRRAAHRLAVSRDARVMLQAFTTLAGPTAARRFPELQKALQENYRRETARFRNTDSVAAAQKILKKLNRRVRSLKIPPDSWPIIVSGLIHSYQLGQQAGELVRRQPSPENFHEWRKAVKTFWHQLRLLCPKWPGAMRALPAGLALLGEHLGDDHDLYLLQQFVAGHSAGQMAEAKALKQRIAKRQKKLRAAALKLGGCLYAETPAAVGARLGRQWQTWHGSSQRPPEKPEA